MQTIKLKTKKLIYAKLIETLVYSGYDITEWLNPTYKNLNMIEIINLINRLNSDHIINNEIVKIEDYM
tara:strand:+ start:501 stop:704 length:204 start_codon:yes stop_codon:yes gene_type:complete